MDYPFEVWQEPLKRDMFVLIDYLHCEGINFTMEHTFGLNRFEESRDIDYIMLTLFKRSFFIGIKEPKFYMIHAYLGDGCRRVVDRTDFESFDEMFKWIKEYDG